MGKHSVLVTGLLNELNAPVSAVIRLQQDPCRRFSCHQGRADAVDGVHHAGYHGKRFSRYWPQPTRRGDLKVRFRGWKANQPEAAMSTSLSSMLVR